MDIRYSIHVLNRSLILHGVPMEKTLSVQHVEGNRFIISSHDGSITYKVCLSQRDVAMFIRGMEECMDILHKHGEKRGETA